MPVLHNSLHAWEQDDFPGVLKREILSLDAGMLPLEQGLSRGGLVDTGNIDATVIGASDEGDFIVAHVGMFFTEIIGGCSCGDEPEHAQAYCILKVSINKRTAETTFTVLTD